MFQVIPNWHPLFVHFPAALLTMATIFFLIKNFITQSSIHAQIKLLAYWNLWLGTLFAILTAIAGWFAYNSVTHDAPSHLAMTEHRNWALVTLVIFIAISLWSIRQYRNSKEPGLLFSAVMLVAFVLLASTAWHGSEVVYRHGLGVMSLPSAEGSEHNHHHDHQENMTPDAMTLEQVTPKQTIQPSIGKGHNDEHHDHSQHEHTHE